MDDLIAARALMGVSLAFHIVWTFRGESSPEITPAGSIRLIGPIGRIRLI